MKKDIKQSREEERRKNQRSLEKPHEPVDAFTLFKAHYVSTDASTGSENIQTAAELSQKWGTLSDNDKEAYHQAGKTDRVRA